MTVLLDVSHVRAGLAGAGPAVVLLEVASEVMATARLPEAPGRAHPAASMPMSIRRLTLGPLAVTVLLDVSHVRAGLAGGVDAHVDAQAGPAPWGSEKKVAQTPPETAPAGR